LSSAAGSAEAAEFAPGRLDRRVGRFLIGAGDEARRLALLAKIERRPGGLGAGEKMGTAQPPGARPGEIGNEGPAGIGRDRGQRSRTRTKAETMQGENSLRLCVRTGICRHGVPSDATARWPRLSKRPVSGVRRNALETFIFA